MANLYHYFPIKAPIEKVFAGISTPKGLNIWWCLDSKGKPNVGETYQLSFGPEYQWTAVVSKCIPNQEFELTLINADSDWMNSKVGFALVSDKGNTIVHFYHTGWKEDNEHYRISNYCWAMYLRLLKRNLEFGEEVPYESRLDV